MKLYIVTGRINGTLGFACSSLANAFQPSVNCASAQWNMTAFTDVKKANALHDDLKHGTAKLCKVVEIEIPDE